MSKTKTPFFGLDAHGSVGRSITAQQLPGSTLIRTKPLPTYRYTLPQAYQRWLYEDYAYLWTQQSLATRQSYQSLGVPFHLTGFQYWMKYNLTHLPDIAGMWRFDSISGAITPDSSRNLNHGTLIGASPSTGLIDGALLFDGLNDQVNCGSDSSLDLTSDKTFECFLRLTTPGTTAIGTIFHRIYAPYAVGYMFVFSLTGLGGLSYYNFNLGAWRHSIGIVNDGNWHHVAVSCQAPNLTFYIDGQPSGVFGFAGAPTCITDAIFGVYPGNIRWFKGDIDHFIAYNRALDATEILRHSLRRYPT